MVLFPEEFKVSRSLAKTLRNGPYSTRLDTAFGTVIRACAAPRRSGADTWLNDEMIDSYGELHRLGFGHSVETYLEDRLVGGLYGIQLGGVFFGESMFSRERDASKVALARLVEECPSRAIRLIDCQVASAHLASLGARELPRSEFAALLRSYARRIPSGGWARSTGLKLHYQGLYAQCARLRVHHKDACQKKRQFNSKARSSRPCRTPHFASS